MAELPGWDRDRLRTAPDADVEAARLIVYARQWKPFLTRDLPDEIEELGVALRSERDPKVAERHEHKKRLEAVEALKQLVPLQAAIRTVLDLEVRADG